MVNYYYTLHHYDRNLSVKRSPYHHFSGRDIAKWKDFILIFGIMIILKYDIKWKYSIINKMLWVLASSMPDD